MVVKNVEFGKNGIQQFRQKNQGKPGISNKNH